MSRCIPRRKCLVNIGLAFICAYIILKMSKNMGKSEETRFKRQADPKAPTVAAVTVESGVTTVVTGESVATRWIDTTAVDMSSVIGEATTVASTESVGTAATGDATDPVTTAGSEATVLSEATTIGVEITTAPTTIGDDTTVVSDATTFSVPTEPAAVSTMPTEPVTEPPIMQTEPTIPEEVATAEELTEPTTRFYTLGPNRTPPPGWVVCLRRGKRALCWSHQEYLNRNNPQNDTSLPDEVAAGTPPPDKLVAKKRSQAVKAVKIIKRPKKVMRINRTPKMRKRNRR